MGKIRVKICKEPTSVSRATVKAAVEAVYRDNSDYYKATSPKVIVQVTKKTSTAK